MASLEGTIHERWQDKAALNSLLASNRISTGNNNDRPPPYAILLNDAATRKAQSSQNRIDDATIRIELYHADYDEGRAIITQICRKAADGGFHLDAFAITDGGNVASVRAEDQGSFQDERGTWVFAVALLVTYQRP